MQGSGNTDPLFPGDQSNGDPPEGAVVSRALRIAHDVLALLSGNDVQERFRDRLGTMRIVRALALAIIEVCNGLDCCGDKEFDEAVELIDDFVLELEFHIAGFLDL